ncbi:MAG TPA: hypothetical protein VJQ47_05935 [Steroidobacteraceae bacterium]|nr:hypothetical protein [Steroidobacteraceae bacterium]
MIEVPLDVSAQHPAYSGHFPGNPVLPAACLIDAVLHAMSESGAGRRCWHVASAKFPTAVQPGDALRLEHERLPNGTVRFAIRCKARVVASGLLTPAPDELCDGQQA